MNTTQETKIETFENRVKGEHKTDSTSNNETSQVTQSLEASVWLYKDQTASLDLEGWTHIYLNGIWEEAISNRNQMLNAKLTFEQLKMLGNVIQTFLEAVASGEITSL